ncbi:MAG TPA: hypothetical protein VN688_02340 [Gemmataceae bacterium]|nr:hypothetical protein [Gemmataceae bacterium]
MEWKHEDETERGGWLGRLHLSWPALFLLGWLLYEFTAQPGPAALVACAKFGWGDVRTAFWLRRVDPDRRRGRTCFWSYLAFGLWKVAMMATVTMIVIGFLSVIVDCVQRQPLPNKNGVSAVFGGVLTAATMGFGLALPAHYIALWLATRNGVRLWLGYAPNRARKERFWPPRHGQINAAPFVFFTLGFVTLWVFILLLIGLVLTVGANVAWEAILLCGVLMSVCILAMGILALSRREHGVPWLFARSPHECWVAEEDEEVYQAATAEERVSEA